MTKFTGRGRRRRALFNSTLLVAGASRPRSFTKSVKNTFQLRRTKGTETVPLLSITEVTK